MLRQNGLVQSMSNGLWPPDLWNRLSQLQLITTWWLWLYQECHSVYEIVMMRFCVDRWILWCVAEGQVVCLPAFSPDTIHRPQEAQQAYSHTHARTRARVETTSLKARFQCLQTLRVSPLRAGGITVACAVLHNVACLRKKRPQSATSHGLGQACDLPWWWQWSAAEDQYVLNYCS